MVTRLRILSLVLAAALFSSSASAAVCVNRFLARSERTQQVVTLLTGKLTFQEAQALAAAIRDKKSPAMEWVDDSGKTLARQFGEVKIVRPMPVGCDGKTSGVVMIVTFGTPQVPSKKMNVRLDAKTTVAFDQQSE